ncbi:MAG TPA: sigma-E factor negative regulatory protein [Steroidobacteraceae bacterium]|jgi:negative regulator of sigma E activity|nr:sigma-E factor negative regulatory protein [Steroidobacteraceae bacterium]
MSEQIREQVSAFLDGELPSSETELLLKRLMRDADLREGFGRYALIGEALRRAERSPLSRGFAAGVNAAIDGEAAPAVPLHLHARAPRWWRPVAGAAVAAGVAAVAVVALQQRAVSPSLRAVAPITVQNLARPKEALSYTVPTAAPAEQTPAMLPAARLTSYVFAHSRYSSVLGQSNVLSGLLADADEQAPAQTNNATGGAAVNRDAINRDAINRDAGDAASSASQQGEARIDP